MFKQFYLFELKYRLRRPATWFYALVIFAIAFLLISTGSTPATEKVHHNSAIILAEAMIILSIFGSLISSAIMGVPVYRDVEHKSQYFLFAYPVNEKQYLLGRYFGSLTILLIVPIAGMLGLWLGTFLGPAFDWEQANRYGENVLGNYFLPFLIFSVVNYLFTGTLFFALVAITRKAMSAYVGSILFLIAYLISGVFMQDLDTREIAAFFDPFGLNVITLETRYFTPFEINASPLPLTKNLLLNRLFWLGLSVIFLAFTIFKFSFKSFFIINQKKAKKAEQNIPPDLSVLSRVLKKNYSFSNRLITTLQLAKIEFLSVIRDKYFISMILGGVIFLFIDGWFGSQVYGVPDLPTTFNLIQVKDFNYTIFVWVILLFYTGEVVHRNRSLNFAGIFDALPVPNWMNYISKFLGISLVAFLLCCLVIVSGVSVQLLKGFTDIDFAMYFTDLFLIEFPEYLLIVMLAFFVHVLVNSKFTGHFVGIGIWIIMWGIRSFGEIDYNLFFYGYMPGYILSDMNRFGHFFEPILWFNIYWLSVGALLLCIGYLFWIRGVEEGFKKRFIQAKAQLKPLIAGGMIVLLVISVSAGSYIYYNVSVLNKYVSSKTSEKIAANYEKAFKKYEKVLQPKYTAVKLYSDIFPQERKIINQYITRVQNKNKVAIDTLYFNLPKKGNRLLWNAKPLKASFIGDEKASPNNTHFMKMPLPEPLQPGKFASLIIYDTIEVKGFGNSDINPRLTYNGTFMDLTPPTFGYEVSIELESDNDRKKQGLPPKDYDLPVYTDEVGRSTFLFNKSADLVSFEAIVSTSVEQIAIAPGYLQKQWNKGNRAYFHYKVDEPIDLFYSVVSAKYALAKDKVTLPDGRIIPIEIYYHPQHDYNLSRFIKGTQDALVYNSTNFSPYQFKQIRVLEFPRYLGFAQSFPNTVPFSESFAWLGDFSDPNDYDYAYYVTAHEMGHQWWGHQLIPNMTRGANLLSESLAEYSAIMVAEHTYGKDNLRKFLKEDLDRYLRGRAMESKKENVFIDCNRSYQWYQKGSLILYALRDYIGEDSLNAALKNFMTDWGNKSVAPYAGSHDLYAYIEAATPQEFKYFVEESWKKITLYDNKVITASAKKLAENKYEVVLKLNSRKFYADSAGAEIEGKYFNDQIDIGIFGEDKVDAKGHKTTHPLYFKKHVVSKSGEIIITAQVSELPKKAGIDPYNKLIDRVSDDNLQPVVID